MERGIKLEFQKIADYEVEFSEDILPLAVIKKIKELNIRYEAGFIGEDDLKLGIMTALVGTDIDIPLFLDPSHQVKSSTPSLKLNKVLKINL